MYMSNRTRQIVELLINAKQDLTVAEIANQVEVSARTVHRELTNVEDLLATFDILLIRKAGSGIKLQGSNANIQALVKSLSSNTKLIYNSDDRQLLILCMLLAIQEPIKLFALGYDLKVNIPTITNDLNELDDWVEKWGVTLIRKRGLGVMLSGTETQLRELIFQLVKQRLNPTELIADPHHLAEHPIYSPLFQLAGKSMMSEVESTLWLWEEQWASRLSEHAYTDLLLRLSITLNRIRSGHHIEVSEWKKQKQQEITLDPSHERLIELLASHFDVAYSAEEKEYMCDSINKIKNQDALSLLGDNLSLTHAIQNIIHDVQLKFSVDFSEDRALRDGLFHHMKATLHRLDDGLAIRNPLLEQIMKDYDQLFETVRMATKRYLPDIRLPNEEIGYIVTHFGAALERLKQLQRDVHAILVCSTGIGSSMLLQVRLQKEFPQIKIVNRVSWYEASRIPRDMYDIIISTIDLPINPMQYLKVSPLITQEDADRLLAYVRDTTILRKPYPVAIQSSNMDTQSDFEQLKSEKITLDQILWLIEHFEVVQINQNLSNLSEILDVACHYEQLKNIVVEPDLVKHRLLEREKSGSQMILDTPLALFHTRSTSIQASSLKLYRLKQSILIDKQSKTRLEHFLLMLAPQSLPWESLEVLSEISALLLEEELMELLVIGEEEAIRHYLAAKLHAFYKSKIKGE